MKHWEWFYDTDQPIIHNIQFKKKFIYYFFLKWSYRVESNFPSICWDFDALL